MSDTYSISTYVCLGNTGDQCEACCEFTQERPCIFVESEGYPILFCRQCLKDALEIMSNPKSGLKEREL